MQRLLPLVALAFFIAACGSSTQRRPIVVATSPGEATTASEVQGAVRIEYDEPIEILNAAAVSVRADGLFVPVRLFHREDDPNALWVLPTRDTALPPDALIVVRIVSGAVVNPERHYAIEDFVLSFTNGPAGDLWVGRGPLATPLDRTTLLPGTDVPTPAGQDIRGLLASAFVSPRIFAQLAHGDGAGEALAWFAPGDATMTTIPLTHGGSDLFATADTVAFGPDGLFIYGAWRDEALGRVRLTQVSIATQTEVATLLLSPPAGLDTAPLGLVLEEDQRRILVACTDGVEGRLVHVDIATFTEVDRDGSTADVQGEPLVDGAGILDYAEDRAMVVPLGETRATLVATDVFTFTQVSSANGIAGVNAAVSASRDRLMRMQGLAGYADGEGILLRTRAATFPFPTPVPIDDALGGVSSGATSVVAIGAYPFDDRFLVVLDNDVAALFLWNGLVLTQEDWVPATAEIDAVDLSATAPGIRVVGRAWGAIP